MCDGGSVHEHEAGKSAHPSRREALRKTAVAAAAAGVVWSSPRIEGLSLRPAYAAASSGGSGVFNLSFSIPAPIAASASPCCPGSGGPSFNLIGFTSQMNANAPSNNPSTALVCDFDYNGPGSVTGVNITGAFNTSLQLANGKFNANADVLIDSATITFNFVCV